MKRIDKIDEVLDADYYYSEIAPVVKESFSYEQKKEIKGVLKRAVQVPSKKIVSFNQTFWFIKKFYITIYLGLDRRGNNQRQQELPKSMKLLNILVGFFLVLLIILMILIIIFCILYTIKSGLGIDLMKSGHLNDVINKI